MTNIVREHNLLTGYRFVIVEYAVVGFVLGLLGVYYLAVGRLLDAFVWLGIVVNCGVIAVLAIRDLRAGATDLGVLPLRNRTFRETVGREHPGLGWRTTVLILVTFAPYLLAVAVLVEGVRVSSVPGRQQLAELRAVLLEVLHDDQVQDCLDADRSAGRVEHVPREVARAEVGEPALVARDIRLDAMRRRRGYLVKSVETAAR